MKTMETINYIDLGLPSGTLWADRNIGAETPEKYGNYYTFSEVQDYSNSECQVPTWKDIQELLVNCNYDLTKLNDVKGGLFTSKINGNSIFIPAAGECFDAYSIGFDGYYWSSSARRSFYAYSMNFYDGGAYMGESEKIKHYPVRLVI